MRRQTMEGKQIYGARPSSYSESRSFLPGPQAPIPTQPILGQQDIQNLGLSRLSYPDKVVQHNPDGDHDLSPRTDARTK
jgi:hypothetical protein